MKRFTRFYPLLMVLFVLVLAGCAGGGGAEPGADPGAEGSADTGREGMVLITGEDAAQGLELHVGDQAVLMLEEGYDWAVNTTPDMVFSMVKGAALEEGEQGIFEAKFAGSATVQAIGKPVCLKDNPPCADPQKQYLIKIRVRPASQ